MPRNYSVKETIQRAKDKHKQKEMESSISIETNIVEETEVLEITQNLPEEFTEEKIQEEVVIQNEKPEKKKGLLKSLFGWFK